VAQVIDASVAVAWCATTQASPLTDAAFELAVEQGGHVPAQFWFEVLHGLARLERNRAVERVTVDTFVEKLAVLALRIDGAYSSADMLRLHRTARRYVLNIYDAAYLELALRLGLPLATRDASLARAAKAAGVPLFSA
jgi:predicted nucleic acid-binding protein